MPDPKLRKCSPSCISIAPLSPRISASKGRLGGCASAVHRSCHRKISSARDAFALSAAAANSTTHCGKVPAFPFVCISGQEELRLALLLNVVDPRIGGVLVMGDRGTGKSVAVRGLAELLPNIEVIAGDPYNSHPKNKKLMGPDALKKSKRGETFKTVNIRTPLVELPLGATEDRVCGTLDIERALSEGVQSFEPGLLAKVNRGILYVDEVNLLEDNIVDLILDSAASGVNIVEREGISVAHPSRFIMVGSANSQEGELRPQLIDRFGLYVRVETLLDREIRTKIVLDRLRYDLDPDAFVKEQEENQAKLSQELLSAQKRLNSVQVSEDVSFIVAKICARLSVEGVRGDLVTYRAARALVALERREEVTLDDIERVLCLCLNHRMRKDPLDPIDSGSKVMNAFRKVTDPTYKEPEAEKSAEPDSKPGAWKGLNF